jgi:hypothetical protein
MLLDLSEKEIDLIKSTLLAGLKCDPFDFPTGETYQKHVTRSNSVLKKIEVGEKPSEDFLITFKDLFSLVSVAKSQYLLLKANLSISNQKVEEVDFKHIALANSLIMWLNNKGLLKQIVKFDMTDDSCWYEEEE